MSIEHSWYYAPVSLRLDVLPENLSWRASQGGKDLDRNTLEGKTVMAKSHYFSGTWLLSERDSDSPAVIISSSPLLGQYYNEGSGLAAHVKLQASFESGNYHPSLVINVRPLERASQEISRFVHRNFTFWTSGHEYNRKSNIEYSFKTSIDGVDEDSADSLANIAKSKMIKTNLPMTIATIVLSGNVKPPREFAMQLGQVQSGNTPVTILALPFGGLLNHSFQSTGIITYKVKCPTDRSLTVLLLSDTAYIPGMEGGLVIAHQGHNPATTIVMSKVWKNAGLSKSSEKPPALISLGLVAGLLRKNTGEGQLLTIIPWNEILHDITPPSTKSML
ncbi:hypothetical protein NADFUDRAFT_50983 [Nadsonia fulvescens var. elongata DSM 6958]|uniref:Uncharacterized protein n=1 Tax=Nadsonia fulvescens var. elongata DSM 6958 TaxID=857566 RepID=A0A1E3PK30_9ASCO|nr:hypothetical protein NADFUDRAFT_50983 [Nadsonia fulvescens var. elongata DSM 6958]